jgi:hypothetical protein
MPERRAVAVCMYDYLGAFKGLRLSAGAGIISLPSLSIKYDVATAIQLPHLHHASTHTPGQLH